MIAIDIFMQPMSGFDAEAEENFVTFCSATHPDPDMLKFYLDCLDQNLILNIHYWEPANWRHLVHPWVQSLTRFYSIDLEKAQLFLDKVEDMSADFSIKQHWNQLKFDITCALTEVDFDQETPQYEVANRETGRLLDLTFPVMVGSREKYLSWPELYGFDDQRSPSAIVRAQALINRFKQ